MNFKAFNSFIKQQEIIITSVLIILSVILLSLIFIKPNLEKVTQISGQKSQMENQLAILKNKYDLLAKVDSSQMKDNFNKLSVILPDNKDYVSLFNTFDSLEYRSGVSIVRTSFSLGSVSTPSGKLVKSTPAAYALPLSIGVIGDVVGIGKFLDLLKDMTGRLITVEKLDFSFKQSGNIEMNLVGKAYFYPYPSTIGGIASPLTKLNTKQEDLYALLSKLPPVRSSDEDNSGIAVGKKNLFQ